MATYLKINWNDNEEVYVPTKETLENLLNSTIYTSTGIVPPSSTNFFIGNNNIPINHTYSDYVTSSEISTYKLNTVEITSISNSGLIIKNQTSSPNIDFLLTDGDDPDSIRTLHFDELGLYLSNPGMAQYLGTSDHPWNTAYINSIQGTNTAGIIGSSNSPFQNVYTMNLYTTTISSSQNLDIATNRYIYLYKDQVTTGLVIDTTELEIGATNAADWSIGNLSIPFGDVFTNRLTCPLIETAWNNQLSVQGDIVPASNGSFSIGISGNEYQGFYGNSIHFPEWTSSAQTNNGIYFGDRKVLYQPDYANRLWLGHAKFDRSYLTTGTGWWITVYDLGDNSSHQVNITTNSFGSTSDNDYYLGYSNHRWKSVYAVQGTIQTSDRSLKSDIHYIDSPKIATRSTNSLESSENSDFTTDDLISFIKKLNPAVFRYGKEGSTINEALQTNDTEAVQLGLIADDIKDEKLFNYIGATMHYEDEDTKEDKITLGLKSVPLAVLALSACKYLLNKVKELEQKIDN